MVVFESLSKSRLLLESTAGQVRIFLYEQNGNHVAIAPCGCIADRIDGRSTLIFFLSHPISIFTDFIAFHSQTSVFAGTVDRKNAPDVSASLPTAKASKQPPTITASDFAKQMHEAYRNEVKEYIQGWKNVQRDALATIDTYKPDTTLWNAFVSLTNYMMNATIHDADTLNNYYENRVRPKITLWQASTNRATFEENLKDTYGQLTSDMHGILNNGAVDISNLQDTMTSFLYDRKMFDTDRAEDESDVKRQERNARKNKRKNERRKEKKKLGNQTEE